ncbi:hypothetical protein [Pseudomonas sp. URMO17WK12:I12]|uniref:hypothetical protein n=1 Tax=Pseudomonas sp. URMO17WK12:I12 TaxID=1259797 RepID=UPI000486FF4F|nr:hypothetical protein [Pseudomonas sp. URMO17WK12:I12]
MIKYLIPLVMVALLIAISGSSCHDRQQDNDENAVQHPPFTDGNGKYIPQQQLQPSTMPRQRM